MTPLARALAAMNAGPDEDALRLAFFHEFAASEVRLLGGETPRVFETSVGPLVMVFDTDEGLADFADGPVDRAILPGRALVQALAGKEIGVTLQTSLGDTLLEAGTLDWLADQLLAEIDVIDVPRVSLAAPRDLSPDLLAALERAMGRMAGLAERGWLFESDGGLVLALEGAEETAEAALSRGVAEALRFSGWDGTLSVAFVDATAALRLSGRALRIDLPSPPARPQKRKDMPPRLR